MNEINDVFVDDKKTKLTFLPNRNAYRCIQINGYVIHARKIKKKFQIQTIEGMMKGEAGDWIIKNLAGELYPMAHPVFIKNYEKKEK